MYKRKGWFWIELWIFQFYEQCRSNNIDLYKVVQVDLMGGRQSGFDLIIFIFREKIIEREKKDVVESVRKEDMKKIRSVGERKSILQIIIM